MSIRPLFAALAVLALAGCAADPAPNEQIRLTEKALIQAKAVGATADDVPEMKLAEDKFSRAQGDMTDQSYKHARMRAEQAELDARLAEAKVLTLKSEEQLDVLNTRITRLRKQLGDAQ
ncbi:MAG: putative lipoprotein [Pseudomonas sp.]|nr:putative lipoprotein [Pseudomonas sp.]